MIAARTEETACPGHVSGGVGGPPTTSLEEKKERLHMEAGDDVRPDLL